MRIAQVAPPYLEVPPRGYGGIEQVVALLADGLVARGHDVTLFAAEGSRTAARLESPVGKAPGPSAIADPHPSLLEAIEVAQRYGEFDVVHDHTVAGPAVAATGGGEGDAVMVHTLHGPWTQSARAYYERVQDRVALVAISETQRALNPNVEYAGVVPNGIDVDAHPFRAEKDDYLLFVGRCNGDKCPEDAVEVAARCGVPLVMVLKRAEPHEQRHWDEAVVPRLTGNEVVLESLPHAELADLMAGARALVFPIKWDEPFGLVMTEAMACGTPVITCPLGAARELIDHGTTGFLTSGVDEMVAAVESLDRIAPDACRERVERWYSKDAMVDGYERVFESLLGC